MFRGISKILKFVAILLASAIFKNLVDSIWLVLTGLDSNGLSSLITVVILAFSPVLILPLGDSSKRRVRRFFKEALIFLLIWLAASFSAALLHQPGYTLIGSVPALLYILLRLGQIPSIGFRIICEDQLGELKDQTLLLSVAPAQRVVFLQRFGFKGLLKVLKGEARIRSKIPEELFIKTFKHCQTLEFSGNLYSFVKRVEEGLTNEVAILCEARPRKDFFNINVKIASDNPQSLRDIVGRVSKLDPDCNENIEMALEKWRSLKPYIKSSGALDDAGLKPDWIRGRLLIAGNQEDVEKLALQICLSQLRRNAMVLILCDERDLEGDPIFKKIIERTLEERGFRPFEKPAKTYRNREGMEIVFIDDFSNKALTKKVSSKPVVALWLRNHVQGFDANSPVKLLTLREPCSHLDLEVDNMMLVNCNRSLVECFLPVRHGLALEGKMAMVSAEEVKVLR